VVNNWKHKCITFLFAHIIALLIILSDLPCALAMQDEINILVLHQYDVDYTAHQVFNNGLIEQLQKDEYYKFNFTYEYLKMDQFPNNEVYLAATANYFKLKQEYSNRSPDVIISSHGMANFLARYGNTIFGDVPIISIWDGNDKDLINLKESYSQCVTVSALVNFDKNIELILNTQQNIENIYVVIGNSPYEINMLEQIKKAAEPYKEEVNFIYLNNLSYDNMLASLRSPKANSAVLFVRYMVDAEGNAFVPVRVLDSIIKDVNTPVYGTYSQYLGSGIVGGYLYDFYRIAQLSAELAIDVIEGSSPEELTLADEKYQDYVFDWQAMKRWGIDTSVLPDNSRIEYSDENPWEQYAGYIVAGCIVIGIETLLILDLIKNRKKRLQAEADLLVINNLLEKLVDERTVELRETQARLMALNKQLDLASRIDPLTQLYNRRHIEERLKEEYEVFLRTGQVFSIMLMDVDDFKKVNDQYGHDVGDMVLKKLSETILKSVRNYDVVARWGGEEFLVLFPRLTSDHTEDRAYAILKAAEENPFYYKETPIPVTLSIGVATIKSNETIRQVIKRADDALYKGKSTGKNRVIMT